MTTQLTVLVTVGQVFASNFRPTAEQLRAESVLDLSNGQFVLSEESSGNARGATPSPVDVQIASSGQFDVKIENGKTLRISSKARAVQARNGLYYVVFRRHRICLKGLPVRLLPDNGSSPIALTGTMQHRLHSGDFRVATVNDPQGDVLKKEVQSRFLSVKP